MTQHLVIAVLMDYKMRYVNHLNKSKFYEKVLKYCSEKGAYMTSGEGIISWWEKMSNSEVRECNENKLVDILINRP